MAGDRPRICAAVVDDKVDRIQDIEPLVDIFEVRIDLIGPGWPGVAERLGKPWLATNRRAPEGGAWQGSEGERTRELLHAVELGAGIIDIELQAPDIKNIVEQVRGRAECLVSYHDFKQTPSPDELRYLVMREQDAGADICKVVTTARTFADNLAVLRLIRDFPDVRLVSFAMGEAGRISRVLAPLAGAPFTYASVAVGSESAAGQVTVEELHMIYGAIEHE